MFILVLVSIFFCVFIVACCLFCFYFKQMDTVLEIIVNF